MKFICKLCNGIVILESEVDITTCGLCGAQCNVPAFMSEGVVIDDFLIEKKIGQGGMGEVFLAHQFSLDRKVALKILNERISQNTTFRNQLINEARSVASLNHPNIIQAYKVGFEENRTLFFAMQFIEGRTLQDLLEEKGKLDELETLNYTLEIVSAIGYAWNKRKLVHRDIKPENIMISDEEKLTKLMDLGLSCIADKSENDDKISGTPQFISPEQIMGNEIDFRADLYSLGATVYYLLTGKFPFTGSLEEMLKKHLSENPENIKEVNPEISELTSKIVHKLLEKEPDNRYQSTDLLINDLNSVIESLKSKMEVPTNHSAAKQKTLNKKIYIGSLCLIFTILLISLIVGFQNKDENAGDSSNDKAFTKSDNEKLNKKTPQTSAKQKGAKLLDFLKIKDKNKIFNGDELLLFCDFTEENIQSRIRFAVDSSISTNFNLLSVGDDWSYFNTNRSSSILGLSPYLSQTTKLLAKINISKEIAETNPLLKKLFESDMTRVKENAYYWLFLKVNNGSVRESFLIEEGGFVINSLGSNSLGLNMGATLFQEKFELSEVLFFEKFAGRISYFLIFRGENKSKFYKNIPKQF